jgi:hypothetical protein
VFPCNILVSRYTYAKLNKFIRILKERKNRGFEWLWFTSNGMFVSQRPRIKNGVLWDCGRYEVFPKTNKCINSLVDLGLADEFVCNENSISIDDVLTRWSMTKLTYL